MNIKLTSSCNWGEIQLQAESILLKREVMHIKCVGQWCNKCWMEFCCSYSLQRTGPFWALRLLGVSPPTVFLSPPLDSQSYSSFPSWMVLYSLSYVVQPKHSFTLCNLKFLFVFLRNISLTASAFLTVPHFHETLAFSNNYIPPWEAFY